MLNYFHKIFLLVFVAVIPVLSQSFGFGCLGFVGGFGGYSYQQYKPIGLNRYVVNFNNDPVNSQYIENEMSEFGKTSGYRIGINVFRAKFTGIFITAKGYYQQLSEEHKATVIPTAVTFNYDFNLTLKSWGIGVDLGIPITDYLSWKILDGSLLINSARFTRTINSSEGTSIEKFDNDKTELGYSVGTGFIIDLVEDYISFEGVASYSQYSIDKMKAEDGSGLLYSTDKKIYPDKFIASGGFNAVVQLNIGFPL